MLFGIVFGLAFVNAIFLPLFWIKLMYRAHDIIGHHRRRQVLRYVLTDKALAARRNSKVRNLRDKLQSMHEHFASSVDLNPDHRLGMQRRPSSVMHLEAGLSHDEGSAAFKYAPR